MSAGRILWGQIGLVLALVLAGVVAAGQWTAWRLGYQAALGEPWLWLDDHALYPPFAFFWWWFVYDAYAPRVFLEGAVFIVTSVALAIGCAFVLADQLRDLQFAGSLRSTPYVLASRLRRSVWRVLRSGLVAAAFPRPRDRAPSSLLARDLIPVSPPLHPWLEADDRIAPGKRLQIAGLIAHQALHSLSARNERADLLHPLLSQPIMEVGLATPTYELTAGGHDRMLARQAFADRLPESILHRRSKGELTTYYGRVLAENRAQLLSHLLDGLLARHGLIDRAKVEASLQIENLIWQADYADLMLLTVTENWVRAWKN